LDYSAPARAAVRSNRVAGPAKQVSRREPLTVPAALAQHLFCGNDGLAPRERREAQIIGSMDRFRHEWPWMVLSLLTLVLLVFAAWVAA
jgi:hypothetical protein